MGAFQSSPSRKNSINQRVNKLNKKTNKKNKQKKNSNKSDEEYGFRIPETQSQEKDVSNIAMPSNSSQTAGSSKNNPEKYNNKNEPKQNTNFFTSIKEKIMKNAIPKLNGIPPNVPVSTEIRNNNNNRNNNPNGSSTKRADSRSQGVTKEHREKKLDNKRMQQNQISSQYSTVQITADILPNPNSQRKIINNSMPISKISKPNYKRNETYKLSSDNTGKPSGSGKQIIITNNISNDPPNPTVLDVKFYNDSNEVQSIFILPTKDSSKLKPHIQSASENNSQHKNIDSSKHLHNAERKNVVIEAFNNDVNHLHNAERKNFVIEAFNNDVKTRTFPSNDQLDITSFNQTKITEDYAKEYYNSLENIASKTIEHKDYMKECSADQNKISFPGTKTVEVKEHIMTAKSSVSDRNTFSSQKNVTENRIAHDNIINFNNISVFTNENVPDAQNNHCYLKDIQSHSQIDQCSNQANKNVNENNSFFQPQVKNTGTSYETHPACTIYKAQKPNLALENESKLSLENSIDSNLKEFEKQSLIKINNSPKKQNTNFRVNIPKSEETYTTTDSNLFETSDTKSVPKLKSIRTISFPGNVKQDALDYQFDGPISILPENVSVQQKSAVGPNIDKINIEKELINKNPLETQNAKQLSTVELKKIELANMNNKNTKSTMKHISHKQEQEKYIPATSDDKINPIPDKETPNKTSNYIDQGNNFKDNSCVGIFSADAINESLTSSQLPSNYLKSCYNSNKSIEEDSFKPKVKTTITETPITSSNDKNDRPSGQASDTNIERCSSELEAETIITNISSNKEEKNNLKFQSYIPYEPSHKSDIDVNKCKDNVLPDELYGFKYANSDNTDRQRNFSGAFPKSTGYYEHYSEEIVNRDGLDRYAPSTISKTIEHNTFKRNPINTFDSSKDDLKQQIHNEQHRINKGEDPATTNLDDPRNISLLESLNSDRYIDLEDSVRNIAIKEQAVSKTKSKNKNDEKIKNVGGYFIEKLEEMAVPNSSTLSPLPAIEYVQIDTYTPKKELQNVVPDGVDPNIYKSVTTFLEEIRQKAEPFINEIEKFTELAGSNKYYYIEESLRRLIDKLDDMFDDIGDNEVLRDKRKEVYKFIFPLFDRLDEKEAENRAKIQ